MSRRQQRLNVLFREQLADLIHDELRDPRLGDVVSITRVDVAPDLEKATVHVSVLGEPETKVTTIRTLNAAAAFLKRQLLERVRIRRVPHLEFVLDESIAEAAHVLELLKKVTDKDRSP
jgi:ribosome-binding factor A